MSVAERLGLKYLWVDVLCILQDNADFIKESLKMAEIYSQAWVNLAASSSASKTHGDQRPPKAVVATASEYDLRRWSLERQSTRRPALDGLGDRASYQTVRRSFLVPGFTQRRDSAERPERPQPTGSPVAEEPDGRCFFVKEKMNSADGKTYWGNSEDEVAQQTCNDYCATKLATDKAEGKIGSATCFKNDGKPWADDQGNQPSGSYCTVGTTCA